MSRLLTDAAESCPGGVPARASGAPEYRDASVSAIGSLLSPRLPFAARVCCSIAALATVIWFTIEFSPMTELDPGHLDLAGVLIAIAWIEIQHRFRLSEAVEPAAILDRFKVARFRLSAVAWPAMAWSAWSCAQRRQGSAALRPLTRRSGIDRACARGSDRACRMGRCRGAPIFAIDGYSQIGDERSSARRRDTLGSRRWA